MIASDGMHANSPKKRRSSRIVHGFGNSSQPDTFCSEINIKRPKLLTEDRITVKIVDLSGNSILQKVSPDDLVVDLKSKVEASIGVPVASQRLVYNGVVMNDFTTLRSFKMSNESVVHMTLALVGG